VSKAEPRSKNKAEGRSEKELPPIGTRRNPSALQSDFSDKPLPTLAELSQQYDDVRTKREKYKEEQRGAIQGLCKDIELRPEAIEERAKHLREQRDRIIAKKKAQRSQNVHAIQLMASESRPIALVQDSGATDAKTVMHTEAKSIPDGRSSSTPTCDEAYAQRRREVVHTALAQRMKHDLVEAEQHRLLRLQEQQFLELGKKLHEVDRLREANKTREVQLAQALRRQQDQVARNIQRSEASAGRSLNDFTFSEEHD
jgi:stress response protein YsnF